MGGLTSRNKGKRAEREVVNLLQPVINKVYEEWTDEEPPELQRNLMQSHGGGFDIVGLEWMALEVKHHANLSNINSWWNQTLEQTGEGQEPVLFYRKDRVPWRVRMHGYLSTDGYATKAVVDISIGDFLEYLAMRIWEEVG